MRGTGLSLQSGYRFDPNTGLPKQMQSQNLNQLYNQIQHPQIHNSMQFDSMSHYLR